MGYNKTIWQENDLITADKLNNIENGINDVINDVLDLGVLEGLNFNQDKVNYNVTITDEIKNKLKEKTFYDKVKFSYVVGDDEETIKYNFLCYLACLAENQTLSNESMNAYMSSYSSNFSNILITVNITLSVNQDLFTINITSLKN